MVTRLVAAPAVLTAVTLDVGPWWTTSAMSPLNELVVGRAIVLVTPVVEIAKL